MWEQVSHQFYVRSAVGRIVDANRPLRNGGAALNDATYAPRREGTIENYVRKVPTLETC